MIVRYAINGYNKDSLSKFFDMMKHIGTNPNSIYKPLYVFYLHAKCLTRCKYNFMVYDVCTIYTK